MFYTGIIDSVPFTVFTGTGTATTIIAVSGQTPDLDVDLSDEYIFYFGTVSGVSGLCRCNLDGTSPLVIVPNVGTFGTPGQFFPGATVCADTINQNVYFAVDLRVLLPGGIPVPGDADYWAIYMCDYNGAGLTSVVLQVPSTPGTDYAAQMFGMTVDPAAALLFWTQNDGQVSVTGNPNTIGYSIRSCSLSGGAPTTLVSSALSSASPRVFWSLDCDTSLSNFFTGDNPIHGGAAEIVQYDYTGAVLNIIASVGAGNVVSLATDPLEQNIIYQTVGGGSMTEISYAGTVIGSSTTGNPASGITVGR